MNDHTRKGWLRIRYEDLLADPKHQWHRIAAFVGAPADGPSSNYLTGVIRPENTNKWRRMLDGDTLAELEPHIRPTLEYLGYEWVQTTKG